MQVADTVVNPLQYVGVFAANLVLQAWAVLLPVLQTLPEALLLAVTELGSLVLDVTLVLTAAFKAVLLKAVYWSVYCLDVLLQALGALLAALDAWLKSLLAWLLSKDPLGLLLSLLLARPFSGLAHLLLGGTKAAVQWTMVAVETACALLYAAPAALGVVLIPALYVAAAVWRRARRVVVSEPPLSFTLAELDERVARLQPLRVPPLPIEEKRIENELVGFVNAVGANLQPLRVPPLNLDQLAASNAAAGADSLTRAQAMDATLERVPLQASYSVVSSTEVTMGQPSAGYDGLAAVRQQMDSLQRTVANLPPLADAQLANQAREQAEAADVQYGLNKRVRGSQGVPGAGDAGKAVPTERSFVERALEDRNAAETAQLRDDLSRLPDASALDAYEAMPVECFGEAMLRGMGWTDGAPVGRNAAAVVKPIEYVPRPQLLGLGAALPAALPPSANAGRPGKAAVEHKMLPVGPDGRVRNVRNLDEQLVQRTVAGAVVGKRMAIGGGTHAGLVGEVLAIGQDKKATVRLDISGERVTLRVSDLVEVGSQDAEKAQAQRHGGGGGAAGDDRRGGSGQQRGGAMAPPPRPTDGSRPWLTPRVRVRVVSQRLNGGAQYLKKGVILDVVTPTECTIQLDEGGKLVDSVPQRALETVLPKQKGAPLLVVAGRFRGQHATLVGKDSGAGTAHVCLEVDLSVVTLQLDEVAEFVA